MLFALFEIGDKEIAEVIDTLPLGWITTGHKVKCLERDFMVWLGQSHIKSIAVNLATAGLYLALKALGIGSGDEVISTTHTFATTA